MAKRLLSIPLVLMVCCGPKSEPVAEKPKAAQAPPSAAEPKPADVQAGGLTWTAEAPLVARAPKSRMRAAEYGVQGDPEAELSVFYFGEGQGGAVDANITRWLGQLSQPDGSDTEKLAKRSERNVGGITITLIEAMGTYSGGMAMPGGAAPTPQADAMLLGAIASGPKGPVFFKLVGKRSSLEGARAAFGALVDSLRPAS